jgi:hypothetical protein
MYGKRPDCSLAWKHPNFVVFTSYTLSLTLSLTAHPFRPRLDLCGDGLAVRPKGAILSSVRLVLCVFGIFTSYLRRVRRSSGGAESAGQWRDRASIAGGLSPTSNDNTYRFSGKASRFLQSSSNLIAPPPPPRPQSMRLARSRVARPHISHAPPSRAPGRTRAPASLSGSVASVASVGWARIR